ncbi:hypothetical protein EJ08DRAFT_655623 [Tothia fuscella]|uniref:Uncharacterized protein n=1 Tax=Tothia fuscella TaxID=1048955 RepID=A0A9P4P4M4_9PEZI|nr:hypothetical protein EJ08DRAFT_655623 [Tothia fuscella]
MAINNQLLEQLKNRDSEPPAVLNNHYRRLNRISNWVTTVADLTTNIANARPVPLPSTLPTAAPQQISTTPVQRPKLLLVALDWRFPPTHPVHQSPLISQLRQSFNVHLTQVSRGITTYLQSHKPQAILLMDHIIADVLLTEQPDQATLNALKAIVAYAKSGGVVVCMPGRFASEMFYEGFRRFFSAFELPWSMSGFTSTRVRFVYPNPPRDRSMTPEGYETEAWFLRGVNAEAAVYGVHGRVEGLLESHVEGERVVNVAFGECGSGAVGYIGDVESMTVNVGLVWAMVHWSKD